MRTVSKLLLAGAGLAAAAGAAAATERAHVLNVALPDGSVAHIRYVGDVAPSVVFAPAAAPAAIADVPESFAMFDRIAFEMDRQMDAMLRQASSLAAAAPQLGGEIDRAALTAPPGTVQYSVTSYSSSNGASCSQSVQVTALEPGKAPKVVRQSSGDCTAMNSRAATPAVESAAPTTAPRVTPVVYRPTDERKSNHAPI